MEKHYRKENNCLNCGATLQGKFCHICGQENLQIKESFGHMMNHAISDYFHFDHKFFHTLKPLFFKPGFLTNEYMAGRRVQYLHPIKMYIFISLVYFVIFFQSGHRLVNVNTSPANTGKNGHVNFNLGTEAKDTANGNFFSPSSRDTTYASYLVSQQKLPAGQRDGSVTRFYNEKAYAYKAKYGNRTKDVIIEDFQHNIPKMMFLLLPFFALVLMVNFRNNKKYYVEHLIYSFHLHCFIFLFLAIVMLLQMVMPGQIISAWLGFLAFIAIIWYIYRSLREVYGRSTWRTVTKMIGSSLMYLLGFTVCITLAFIITALIAA